MGCMSCKIEKKRNIDFLQKQSYLHPIEGCDRHESIDCQQARVYILCIVTITDEILIYEAGMKYLITKTKPKLR